MALTLFGRLIVVDCVSRKGLLPSFNNALLSAMLFIIPSHMGLKVLIRGGGEMASGIAHRLHQCHMDVLITEIEHPTAVRRAVAFAEAVYQGYQTVEGVKGVSVSNAKEAWAQWAGRNIPLLVDSDASLGE